MIIPKNLLERDDFYTEVIKKCTYSQEDRSGNYDILRQYYLFGAPDGKSTAFNKIYPHVDLLESFLFASETTKFAVHPGEGSAVHEFGRTSSLSRGVNNKWHDSNADRVSSHAITWSLVYGSMLVKLIPKVDSKTKKLEINPFPVHPSSFGVLREDLAFSDRQEAMVHTYYTTKSQLEIDLSAHPQKDAILASATGTRGETVEKPSGVQRIIMGALQPLSQADGTQGTVDFGMSQQNKYLPEVDDDLVMMDELWIWDTNENDYRMVTRIREGMTIYDRIAGKENIFCRGEHPFIQFCPLPLPFYFWGMSEVAGLATIQEWLNERMGQVRKLLNLQVKPPTSAMGLSAPPDEEMYALFAEGGLLAPLAEGAQAGKVERYAPTIPNDIFAAIHEIMAMFADHSGLPNILQGKGETGVRTGKQTSDLSRLASARIKKRSLVIEDSLEKMVTLYLKLMQKFDTTIYRDDNDKEFTAAQFTNDFSVKVDAHSNSPIFSEDKKELAFSLLNAKMITREQALEIIDPPNKEKLLRDLKKIMENEKAAALAEKKDEQAKSQGE